MESFEKLLACAGTWRGSNRVQPSADDAVDESTSTLIVTPILNNTFLRIDQTWSWQGTPQSGSLLIGYARTSGVVTIHWVDTWHNGTRIMPLVGEFDSRGVLNTRGHFPAPPGPDWGWRIEIQVKDSRLVMNMFCVEPEGRKDVGWVWSEFERG